jgi:hypothetical protein
MSSVRFLILKYYFSINIPFNLILKKEKKKEIIDHLMV